MTNQDELVQTIKVLRQEVEVLTTRLRPAGTGHLHTAIGVINGHIDELIEEAVAPFFKEDGYKEHTEAMEQARLRRIQDSAAGKPNSVRDAYLHSSRVKDDVEHTKEYYDTERNRGSMTTASAESLGETIRPMEGENLPLTEGLSNRSIKQKYGQAVQTVSEMMQDELEPLPINTFE